MPSIRFARNCFDAESVIPTKCPCCDAIKLLVIDGQDRIRVVAAVTADDLRGVLAAFDAGKLTAFSSMKDDGGKLH